jgi:hypothetical protein
MILPNKVSRGLDFRFQSEQGAIFHKQHLPGLAAIAADGCWIYPYHSPPSIEPVRTLTNLTPTVTSTAVKSNRRSHTNKQKRGLGSQGSSDCKGLVHCCCLRTDGRMDAWKEGRYHVKQDIRARRSENIVELCVCGNCCHLSKL